MALIALVLAGTPVVAGGAQQQLATTAEDFRQPGTQPAVGLNNFLPSTLCAACHGEYIPSDEGVTGDVEPYDSWAASMMAQAARDPIWQAALAIANQDAASSGEACIRCHAPIGWLGTRSTGGTLAGLQAGDLDGVSCHVCHRLVNPISASDEPPEDPAILAQLGDDRPAGTCAGDPAQTCLADDECGTAGGTCNVVSGQGRFVVDPRDRRRGPYRIPIAAHPTIFSPLFQRSELCAPCHDVSTPTYTRTDGAYVPNANGEAHPTQDPHDMFPEQRTFSEWRESEFARGGVVFPDGRFGGNLTAARPNTVPVSTCQDCHMPDARAPGCDVFAPRDDMAAHFFAGANTWVLGAVLDQYGGASGLTESSVAAAQGRIEQMLRDASDMEVSQDAATLKVRIVNQTGHKLPTGYPEGRRMWINVKFFVADGGGSDPIVEDGRYDFATATLDTGNTTKVYEVRHVIDENVAALTGLPAGTISHLVLSNRVDLDNRIPPRGFTNAAFEEIGAAPAGHRYDDGQHWDDTEYAIPAGATRAEITLYYQTSSREYVEFLRDTAPDGSGENAYQRWDARGKSRPVVMDQVALALCEYSPAGVACDDSNACTVDACDAVAGCLHDALGIPAVREALAEDLGAGETCTAERIPGKAKRAFTRARSFTERAERAAGTAKPKRVERFIRRALKQLQRGAGAITRAKGLSPECAAALAGRLAEARLRGECALGAL